MVEKFAYRVIRESVSMIVTSMKTLLDLGHTPADIASQILNYFIEEVERKLEDPIQKSEDG